MHVLCTFELLARFARVIASAFLTPARPAASSVALYPPHKALSGLIQGREHTPTFSRQRTDFSINAQLDLKLRQLTGQYKHWPAAPLVLDAQLYNCNGLITMCSTMVFLSTKAHPSPAPQRSSSTDHTHPRLHFSSIPYKTRLEIG